MGIKKELLEGETKIETEKEEFMIGRVNKGGERWRIIDVYVREGVEKAVQELEQWTEVEEEGVITIMGDFNARTGKERGRMVMGEEQMGMEGTRNSKDRKINKEGRRRIEFLEEKG